MINAGLNLEQLIAELDNFPQDMNVRFGFNKDLSPNNTESYRGFYEDLAVVPTKHRLTNVREFMGMLLGSVNKTFSGYKGGKYVMGPKSTVWVSAHGVCDQRSITRLELVKPAGLEKVVNIVTKKESF